MDYTARNPNEMTSAERYNEIITILSGAVVRYKISQHNQLNSSENERSLTGLPGASKHSCPSRKLTRVRAEKGAKE